MLMLTTDKHEALCSLSATAELFVKHYKEAAAAIGHAKLKNVRYYNNNNNVFIRLLAASGWVRGRYWRLLEGVF